MTNVEARLAIEQLLTDYVGCLDEDRLEQWPEFFCEDGVYRIVSRENADRKYPLATLSCESKAMMLDRVVAIRNASVFSSRYLRHLVSGLRVTPEQNGAWQAQSSYVVLQTIEGEETKVFSAGKYIDTIVFSDGKPKFKEKTVVYDGARIPGLLVIPI